MNQCSVRTRDFMKRRDRIQKKFGDKRFRPINQFSQVQEPKKESKSFYYRNYKTLLLIPFMILLAAIILLVVQTVQTGEFVNKGITLKGGISVQLPSKTLDSALIKQQMEQRFPDIEIVTRTLGEAGSQKGIMLEANILPSETELSEAFKGNITELTGVTEKDMSIQTIGASLGESFFKQTMVAVLIAFIFMGLIVFLYFRTLVPSAAVILSAFSDIIVTVAVLNILNFKIGTAGIAALLMLIGYSVDTDILLTTRVLKNKEGTVYERIINAMKTGMTMTVTTLAAITVTYFVAESEVLKEIMVIIIIGLLIDVINTWLQNASILRYYLERKAKKED